MYGWTGKANTAIIYFIGNLEIVKYLKKNENEMRIYTMNKKERFCKKYVYEFDAG